MVTGTVSRKNASTCTVCAGRSLSSAQGSVDVPMVNRPAGTSTSAGNATSRARGAGGACSTGAPVRNWWVASMVSSCCCSCCTIMPNANAVLDQAPALQWRLLQHVERLVADLFDVTARLGRTEQGQGRSVRTGVPERVVEVVDVLAHRLPATDVAHQPEFFLIADVREIPHQRGHQLRVLAHQVVVVDRVGQRACCDPGPWSGFSATVSRSRSIRQRSSRSSMRPSHMRLDPFVRLLDHRGGQFRTEVEFRRRAPARPEPDDPAGRRRSARRRARTGPRAATGSRPVR